jgi:putative tryptophan/tyrosine transport system substrate-binding protein
MRRREFIGLAGGAAVAWPLAARAQTSQTLPKIGYLSDETEGPHPFNSHASVLDSLRKLGYEEGRNVAIEYRYAAGRVERLPSLAAELAALPVDVILSVGTVATKAAVAATKTIPIVFSRIGDPVRYGLVASLSHPGGNATGAALLTTDLAEKRLQLLKEMVPGVTSIAVLHEQNFAPGDIEVKQLEAAAAVLNLEVHAMGAAPPEPGALDAVLPDLMKDSPGALFVGSSGWFEDVYQHTLGVASKSHLPALYVRAEYVDAGGLMSYGVNYPDMYRSVVDYLGKILKGAKPADLPVWQPEKIELVINRRTAKALNLSLPLSLVGFAERIIE